MMLKPGGSLSAASEYERRILMLEVKVNFTLENDEIIRLLDAVGFKYDKNNRMVKVVYHGKATLFFEEYAGNILSRYLSEQCAFNSMSVESIIEELSVNEDNRNAFIENFFDN